MIDRVGRVYRIPCSHRVLALPGQPWFAVFKPHHQQGSWSMGAIARQSSGPIERYIFFHDQRHPAEMGAAEVNGVPRPMAALLSVQDFTCSHSGERAISMWPCVAEPGGPACCHYRRQLVAVLLEACPTALAYLALGIVGVRGPLRGFHRDRVVLGLTSPHDRRPFSFAPLITWLPSRPDSRSRSGGSRDCPARHSARC